MLSENLRTELVSAVRVAARERILPRFRALAPGDVHTKSGPADLVTRADTEAEAQITAAIRAVWPEAEVLGEEAVAADHALRARMGAAEWAVVIDPVDGTWNFAKGLPLFGSMVSVLHHGQPVWGMLYDPVSDDWIEAGDGAATVFARASDRHPVRTSDEARAPRLNGYVPLGLFARDTRLRLSQDMVAFARATSLRCACHEYRMLAQGSVEFLLSGPVPHPWDHAAGALCVVRAGGVVRFLDGTPYDANRRKGVLLAAASPAVWDDLAGRFAYLA
ncbi:MAG: inositol monophosphatase [Rubellimicrobium sp.]|nr:inositol monophosphatase [Rubellimicrobium sp.]